MSAEAMARLRKYVDGTATLGDSRSRVEDLRALLDAHAEALDALSDIMTVVNGEESGGVGQVADATNAARAVLAKAGRR